MIRALLFSAAVVASTSGLAENKGGYPSLWDHADPTLQQQLVDIVSQLGYNGAIKEKQLAIALVDIRDLYQPRVAALNGDTMMYAASLPKLAILLGAFVKIREEPSALDPDIRESLTQMIRYSSNQHATRMLNWVGRDRLLAILQSSEFDLYDEEGAGGLWVGKAYGKAPAYQRDPLHNLSHGATPMQVARLYYLLETGQVADEALTAQMKEMLGNPGIHHKFVKGLADYPDAKIYRKSGSWRQWHADSALIEAHDTRYIVVALAENVDGGQWLSRIIKPIHELMVSLK